MAQFRIIRIALTVSLIVATATQPMFALRAAEACGERASSSGCESCGCCQVQESEQRCGCCVSADESGSHAHCGPREQASVVATDEKSPKTHAAVRPSVCLCRASSAPLSEGRQHHRTSEDTVRHDLVLDSVRPVEDHGSFAAGSRPVLLCARGNQQHFSQRVLGVWRN